MNNRFVKYNPVLRRNERDRLIVIAAAALAFCIIFIILIVVNYRSASAREEIAKVEESTSIAGSISSVEVWAPESSVPAGTKLSDVPLKKIYWPRTQLPSGVIRDAAEVQSMYAKGPLTAGLPITKDNLSATPITGTLKLEKGLRAITIEGDATCLVEGFVTSGNKVDVLLTYLKGNTKTTKVLVQNATVLSLGGRSDPEPDPVRGPVGVPVSSTVTLQVAFRDALKIQTAKTMGRLCLMLRASDDVGSAEGGDEFDTNDLEGKSSRGTQSGSNCARGSVRTDGKEYMVNCDGQINQLMNPDEP